MKARPSDSESNYPTLHTVLAMLVTWFIKLYYIKSHKLEKENADK